MWRPRFVVVLVLLVVIQPVPYGCHHTNPPLRAEPSWDAERTRRLAVRVCFDCHSNQAVWPWFSHVAPISWLIQRDVNQGRRAVNFPDWDRRQQEARESPTALRRGAMPPRWYALLRPATRLSASERQDLIRGLDATLGSRKLGTKGGTGAGKDALMGLGVGGITVTEVRGSGHESDRIRDHPNAEYKVDLVPKAAVEVVVADDDVASVVATICQVARTGLVGDGKVFVLPVSAAIRIRTGETGEGVLC